MRLMKSVPNFNARWKIHRERIILNLAIYNAKLMNLMKNQWQKWNVGKNWHNTLIRAKGNEE